MRILSGLVGLSLLFMGSASFAEEKTERFQVAKCLLSAKQSKGFNFYFYGTERKFAFAELVVTQNFSQGPIAVSPDFQINVKAFAKDGKPVTKTAESRRHLLRLVAHETKGGLAIAYDPYSQTTSTDGFLLSISDSESYLNFTKSLSRDGVTYQTPEEIKCQLRGEANFESDPIDTSKLSAEDLAKTMDNYIGRMTWGWLDMKRLFPENTEEAVEEFQAGVSALISKINEDKECGRLRRGKRQEVTDHTGATLGFRLAYYCQDIFELERWEQWGSTWERKSYPGVRIYFNKNAEQLEFKEPMKYTYKGYARYVRDE